MSSAVLSVDNSCVRSGQPFRLSLLVPNDGEDEITVENAVAIVRGASNPPGVPVPDAVSVTSKLPISIEAGHSRAIEFVGVCWGDRAANFDVTASVGLEDETTVEGVNTVQVRIIPPASGESMPLPYGQARFETNLNAAIAAVL